MNIVDERMKLLEVVRGGFGGVLSGSGALVDRRKFPGAVPIQKNELLNAPEPKRLHQCSVCGKNDVWNEDWSWFGSMKDLDDGRIKIKTCSKECYEKYENSK